MIKKSVDSDTFLTIFHEKAFTRQNFEKWVQKHLFWSHFLNKKGVYKAKYRKMGPKTTFLPSQRQNRWFGPPGAIDFRKS